MNRAIYCGMLRLDNQLTKMFTGLTVLLFTGVYCSNLIAGNESNYTYLALGDSVAFGLNPLLLPTSPSQPLPSPSVFVGYPEEIAVLAHLAQSKKEVNASCPGETSGSFVTAGAPDYGCNFAGPQGQPPFKGWVGLHTDYSGTQLQFAIDQLSSNKHIDLVTLGIGSNDLLLALACGAGDPRPACQAPGQPKDIPTALAVYGANLTTILTGIRQTAAYKGKLVLVLQYAPPGLDGLAIALNATTLAAALSGPYGVTFADGYTAFKLAAVPQGGDACKAGLLIQLTSTTCDIHPSPTGRDILANTVLNAIGGKI
jgi:lysophospholipase L1-like esterase